MDKKQILITGGAGFLGNYLTKSLLDQGHSVTVFDNLSSSNASTLKPLFTQTNFSFIQGDILKKELLKRITDTDFIIHLAAQIHADRSVLNPQETILTNILGTLNVLEVAREVNIDLFVYASSAEVYGNAQYIPINEAHSLNPISPYAVSKAAADRLCYSYFITHNLPVVIVRNFNIFGPNQKSSKSVISKFVEMSLQDIPPTIYGDGKQTRDYIYIKDAVRGYETILGSYENVIGKTINLGTGRETQALELCNTIIRLCDKRLKPIHLPSWNIESQRLCADITLARELLNFQPEYTLEMGLKELIEWYKEVFTHPKP